MNAMVPFLWVAGGMHLCIAAANFWVPRILNYRENLAKVSSMVRQVFVVHSLYMVLVLLGISALCLRFARELTRGEPLGRALCAFLAFFWLLRVVLQFAYYDREVRARHRLGDVVYTLATLYLGGVFAIVALGVMK